MQSSHAVESCSMQAGSCKGLCKAEEVKVMVVGDSQCDLTTMGILKEESQLDFHGVPSAAVDDLSLPRVALGVVLQELHHL